ncbi:hypothetical protein [Desulfosporosinus sp. OT]|uniref:hypothetical protein n=1 Tax=Desulfosporosinus sp. OT TaxID=913865 RepID=UPI000223B2F2|nr:hypothetical protein [Desulfosporosinus sp. OT]EGW36063.1 hypothetical protein DOT_6071 [Desulfosporosinus sp. OT]
MSPYTFQILLSLPPKIVKTTQEKNKKKDQTVHVYYILVHLAEPKSLQQKLPTTLETNIGQNGYKAILNNTNISTECLKRSGCQYYP